MRVSEQASKNKNWVGSSNDEQLTSNMPEKSHTDVASGEQNLIEIKSVEAMHDTSDMEVHCRASGSGMGCIRRSGDDNRPHPS